MNKVWLILLPFMLVTNIVISQLVVDAGNEIHSCQVGNNVLLGGNPTASGGVPPYKYSWYFDDIPTGSQSIPYVISSMYIDDTTSANPSIYIGSFLPNEYFIYLKVEDNAGEVGYDTLKLSYSFFQTHLGYETIYLTKGDSVFLQSEPNIDCGFGSSCEYLWQPNYGLSDSTIKTGFWAKPEHNINYTLTVTDIEGCSEVAGGPMYKIIVNTLGVPEIVNLLKEIKIYPNPTSDYIYFSNISSTLHYEVCSTLGETKLRGVISDSTAYLSLKSLKNGIYFVKIYKNKEFIKIYKIVKK